MRYVYTILLTLLLGISAMMGQEIPSPNDYFGFPIGADRKLINWEQILDYFALLDERSPRVQVVELGKTTLGRPMILVIIASEQTMANLDRYRQIQEQIAWPYDLDEAAAEALIQEGKLVFLLTLNIHSTEIAASQESVELGYELATTRDPELLNVLDQVILLMVPSLNPDGQDMITKWYLKDVGTEYEGSRMPMKYHHYADHDNNRDWFFFNLVESRHVARILYHEWYPEIVFDQHQMGGRSARFFMPPYSDPVNPNIPPSLMANTNMIGKHVIAEMHDQGFKGLVTNTIFNAYFVGTMSKTPLWQNRIGILSEAASVRIASPVYLPPSSLKGMGQDLPEYKQQNNFLDPWSGGWWRLRDIIDYEKAATYSMLKLAATYKEKFKRNYYRLNREAIAAGQKGHPFAYVIPVKQRDPNSAVEMLRRLRIANVKVYRAEEEYRAPEGTIQQGDFIIPLAQSNRTYIKDLLERQYYPDLREYPGGPPRRPYDVTAWTLPLQMGVTVFTVAAPFELQMTPVEPRLEISLPEERDGWYAVERRFINSYALINQLLKQGVAVYTSTRAISNVPRGSFLFKIEGKSFETLSPLFEKFEVPPVFVGTTVDKTQRKPLKASRIGIYQPWIPWVYDEGWLRLILDNFGFDYQVLHNQDFKKKGSFYPAFDVLVFTNQAAKSILNGAPLTRGYSPQIDAPKVRPEYRGGIGEAGKKKLQQFIQAGGTAIFIGEAVDFAIEHLGIPARNVLKNVPRKEFFAPGSIVKIHLDNQSDLTLGMPSETAIYINRPVALTLEPYTRELKEVGVYDDREILLSGWVVGEKKLHHKVALADIPYGKGRVILYAFRVHHRGQTWGTFKLLFNALYQ
ncbi:MAG: hypothetical protein GXO78_12520 [Calditrichaeota bacterium]|nr:hypothetical protein [Calditrichota bacterium]